MSRPQLSSSCKLVLVPAILSAMSVALEMTSASVVSLPMALRAARFCENSAAFGAGPLPLLGGECPAAPEPAPE